MYQEPQHILQVVFPALGHLLQERSSYAYCGLLDMPAAAGVKMHDKGTCAPPHEH